MIFQAINHTVIPADCQGLKLGTNSNLKNSWTLGDVRKTTGVFYAKKPFTN